MSPPPARTSPRRSRSTRWASTEPPGRRDAGRGSISRYIAVDHRRDAPLARLELGEDLLLAHPPVDDQRRGHGPGACRPRGRGRADRRGRRGRAADRGSPYRAVMSPSGGETTVVDQPMTWSPVNRAPVPSSAKQRWLEVWPGRGDRRERPAARLRRARRRRARGRDDSRNRRRRRRADRHPRAPAARSRRSARRSRRRAAGWPGCGRDGCGCTGSRRSARPA